jgi:hypothetical protein
VHAYSWNTYTFVEHVHVPRMHVKYIKLIFWGEGLTTLTCVDVDLVSLLVVEPDYLPDSEVLAFSRVYTP